MIRKTLTILCLLGLLLSVGLWGVSNWNVDHLPYLPGYFAVMCLVWLAAAICACIAIAYVSSSWRAPAALGGTAFGLIGLFSVNQVASELKEPLVTWLLLPELYVAIGAIFGTTAFWSLAVIKGCFQARTERLSVLAQHQPRTSWRISRIPTMISLILLLLSIEMWLLSYLRIEYQTPTTRTIVTSGIVWRIPTRQKHSGLSVDGFHWYDQAGLYRGFTTYWMPTWSPFVRIPLWIPTAVFALGFWCPYYLPIRRVRIRQEKGLCVNCGYDLRASKERCPECGREFEST